jgi:hypothetical protein
MEKLDPKRKHEDAQLERPEQRIPIYIDTTRVSGKREKEKKNEKDPLIIIFKDILRTFL